MSESVFFHYFYPDTDSMKGGGDIHVSAAPMLRRNYGLLVEDLRALEFFRGKYIMQFEAGICNGEVVDGKRDGWVTNSAESVWSRFLTFRCVYSYLVMKLPLKTFVLQ
jgi:hypothetical protein